MKDSRKTILYFYHGQGLGGAPLSLLYLIQGLDQNRYRPVVCCLYNSEVVEYYRQHGIETFVCNGLTEFNHTTAGWYPLYNPVASWKLLRETLSFAPSILRTRALIQAHGAALVHLNSVTLLPSAIGAWLAGVPVVWHVREATVDGHFGLRRSLLSWCVRHLAEEPIFICEDNQQRLHVYDRGEVIYNFVDFDRFNRKLPGKASRLEIGLGEDDKVVLFLGGISRIKGTRELIWAIEQSRKEVPKLRCLIAGAKPALNSFARRLLAHFHIRGYTQRLYDEVEMLCLSDVVHFLPFRVGVERLIAAADVVVFPSTAPHFARPVIEAGAMAKPVVASRIGGVEEVVQDGVTGLLVPPGDVKALAHAIQRILSDPEFARSLGEAGYRQARRLFDAETNVRQTAAVYERVLGSHSRQKSTTGEAVPS